MRMKKGRILSLLLAIAYVSLQPLPGLGEVRTQKAELSGLVTEVLEGGIMIVDAEKGPVFLSVDAETVLEGILGGCPLEVGMYVFVKYNGIFTSSTPPQTHADRLGCYALKGIVAETSNGDFLLIGDELFGEALVRVESTMPEALAGIPVTVYYNGTMTMSIPPQVHAKHLVVPATPGNPLPSADADAPPEPLTPAPMEDAVPGETLAPAPSAPSENTGSEENPPPMLEPHHGDEE